MTIILSGYQEGIFRLIAPVRQLHLIYNPTAGRLQRGGGALLARLKTALQQHSGAVADCPTSKPGDATLLAHQAVEAGADLVVVAGGDGTVNEALNGLAGSDTPLAVLPLGTANVLATEMGLNRRPEDVARQLEDLQPYRVSVGLVHAANAEPRYFLLMAGIGLDAHIVNEVDPELKKHLGKLAYWIGGFGQLGRRFAQFHVQVNGDRFDSSFTLASRVRNYGGDLEIARNVSLLDGHFEMVSFQGQDSLRYIGYLTGVLANTLGWMKGVSIRDTKTLNLTPASAQPVYVQVDGEPAGRLPAKIEIVPDALTLMMPANIGRRYGR